MHMADALVSPVVGATMWVAAGVVVAWCARRVQRSPVAHIVPLMGVLGAFVFAAQMINFTIPGTGSSGHIGGGLLLAILIGPHAGLVVMTSVLSVQALLLGDGGLLALGANIFNLGVLPCFVGYGILYRPLVGIEPLKASRHRLNYATVISAVIGLQLGSLGVVLETSFSGVADIRIGTFLALMQPIHLAIGLVEGFATASVVLFLRHARSDLFLLTASGTKSPQALPTSSLRTALLGIGVATALTAGVLSWFASPLPDGLEWSVAHATSNRMATSTKPTVVSSDIDTRESLAGLLGAGTTLCLVAGVAYLLRRHRPSA